MIQRAIKALNEDGGASEGGISEFIKREYEDLPVAHEGFLRHHLRKLCESGVVVSLKCGRYNVANQDDEDDDGNVEDRECHSKRQEGKGRVQGRRQGIEDGGREEEAHKKVFGEKQKHFGVTEDQCEPETKQMQVSGGQFVYIFNCLSGNLLFGMNFVEQCCSYITIIASSLDIFFLYLVFYFPLIFGFFSSLAL